MFEKAEWFLMALFDLCLEVADQIMAVINSVVLVSLKLKDYFFVSETKLHHFPRFHHFRVIFFITDVVPHWIVIWAVLNYFLSRLFVGSMSNNDTWETD